jgi:hypothetical protein
MRLSHPYDRQYDLATQMEQLSRDTAAMLLETLGSIPIVGNGIFNDVQYMAELDWDDKTHTINAEFIPDSGWGNGDRTHLTMSVADTNDNDTKTLTVSVELGHLYTQYHTRYIPIGWKLTIATTTIFSGGSDRTTYLVGGQPRNRIDKIREIRITRGVAIATMRSLAIQMGISLAAKNRRLNSTTIDEMRTHGVPESQETSFLRLGLDRIIDLIRNAKSTNTTD